MRGDAPTPEEFTGWQKIFPIHKEEIGKFVAMAMMLFCVLFCYTLSRIIKDTLIVSSPRGGAEALSFIKGWVVLPAVTLFVVFYAKMSSAIDKRKLYYGIALPFMIFFFCFGFFLYPYNELIHPSDDSVKFLTESLPALKFALPIYSLWSFVLYYTFSELLGAIGVSILFWQFANSITPSKQAKRFYMVFGILSNLALIIGGLVTNYLFGASEVGVKGEEVQEAFDSGMRIVSILTGFSMALLIFLFRYLSNINDQEERQIQSNKPKKPKVKLTMKESLESIIQSKYLGYITILVLAYGITMNLTEAVWKTKVNQWIQESVLGSGSYDHIGAFLSESGNSLRKLKSSNLADVQSFLNACKSEYAAFMGKFYVWTGIATVLTTFSFRNVVRRYGWYIGAILTPLAILVTSVLFFFFCSIPDSWKDMLGNKMGISALALAVFIGAIQNIASKSTKYCLFDPTKEMAYLPLDETLKVKGKAAIDVLGNRLGKSAGGYIQNILFIVFSGSTLLSLSPVLGAIVVFFSIIWFVSVGKLSEEYEAKLAEQKDSE